MSELNDYRNAIEVLIQAKKTSKCHPLSAAERVMSSSDTRSTRNHLEILGSGDRLLSDEKQKQELIKQIFNAVPVFELFVSINGTDFLVGKSDLELYIIEDHHHTTHRLNGILPFETLTDPQNHERYSSDIYCFDVFGIRKTH
jgi:hypothetical protein